MSTSYYYKNKKNKELNDILDTIWIDEVRKAAYSEYYQERTIGQTSAGWVFLVIGDITLEKLYNKIKDKYIFNEYGEKISVEKLFEIIRFFSFKQHRLNYPEYFKNRTETFNDIDYVFDVMV